MTMHAETCLAGNLQIDCLGIDNKVKTHLNPVLTLLFLRDME